MGDEMSYIENEKLRNFLYRNLFLKKLIQISYLYKRQHTLRHKKIMNIGESLYRQTILINIT